jgi:putative ABC transport system substrate-binding protein
VWFPENQSERPFRPFHQGFTASTIPLPKLWERALRRRDFLGLAGWAAVVWPLAVKAQQANKVYRIGLISAGLPPKPGVSYFQDALSGLGWIEGKNLIYERRYAENRLERLPGLVAELIRLNVDVIVAVGTLAPIAAKRATTTIPIVMTTAGDPLSSGLVASLAKPGGNVTGLSLMAPELAGKRLELLKEVIPGLARIAVLWNAANPYSAIGFDQTKLAAERLGIEVQSLGLRSPDDLDGALEDALRQNAAALIAVEDPLTFDNREQIVTFAAKSRLPAISGAREFADAGGLLAYGASLADLSRRAAGYVDKILKGTRPSDLPVEQPTKFDFVINLKTAKSLGLSIPPALLARADEVIE